MDIKDFIARYEAILREKHIPKTEFYEKCGISSSAVSQWNNGKTSPTITTISRIADFLQVDDGYLYSGIKKEPGEPVLNEHEKQFIKQFRYLDDTGRETIQYLLDAELNRVQRIRVLSQTGQVYRNLIPLRRSLQKASAGHGAYLGAEEFEIVYVDETPLTRRASFIIPVAGNSMQPLYNDGDQLLVERADDIDVGEIGIFTVNGDGYVKKRGQNELISLNKEYPNVPLTDDSWCNGRVIGILPAGAIK